MLRAKDGQSDDRLISCPQGPGAGAQFMRLAAEIPIRTHVQLFPLRDANRALNALKNDAIAGAAVLQVQS